MLSILSRLPHDTAIRSRRDNSPNSKEPSLAVGLLPRSTHPHGAPPSDPDELSEGSFQRSVFAEGYTGSRPILAFQLNGTPNSGLLHS